MWTEWDITPYRKRWKDRIPMGVVTKLVGMDRNRIMFDIIQIQDRGQSLEDA